MPDGEDWLWRPALDGIIPFEAIWCSTVDLEAVAVANDLLTLRTENERRFKEAHRR